MWVLSGEMYVKMKELGLGGGDENFVCRSANGLNHFITENDTLSITDVAIMRFPHVRYTGTQIIYSMRYAFLACSCQCKIFLPCSCRCCMDLFNM